MFQMYLVIHPASSEGCSKGEVYSHAFIPPQTSPKHAVPNKAGHEAAMHGCPMCLDVWAWE